MKEQSVESTLANLKVPAPDPEARLRAKRAALAEFARVHAANQEVAGTSVQPKGFWNAFRLSRGVASHGRASMTWFVRRNLFAGVASVCVVGIGIAMVWPLFSRYGEERIFDDVRAPASVELLPPPREGVPPEASVSRPAPELAKRQAELRGATPAAREVDQLQRNDAANSAAPRNESLDKGMAAAAPMEAKEEAGLRDGDANALQAEPQQLVGNASAPVAAAGAVAQAPPVSDAQGSADEIMVTGQRRITGGSKPAPHKGVATSSRASSNAVTLSMPVQAAVERESYARPADEGRDKFEQFESSPVKQVADAPVSTFSADVDTASYSFVRRQLNAGVLPQKDAVRVEEMVNYFDYAWPAATSANAPFRPTVVVSDSPWGKGRKLIHIGIKGYEIDRAQAPDANLVLLLDVSGSMNSPDRLPLAIQSMEMLLSSLKPTDTVGIVVYAGAAGTVLEPTPVRDKQKIVSALRDLRPGGSTAGAEGIERAYQLAEAHFRKGGVNRVLLATDGDFNVGIDSTSALKGFVERKREKGIFLSVLGFGQGNYRDELAQALAQNGNGVAAYIDTLSEAQKVLVEEAGASLFTIAKDVKLQVEFNPATVAEYRLVGYETRALKREDFNNDAVDAGDVGSGHTVTAIYEITPVGSAARMIDKSRYARDTAPPAQAGSAREYGYLKIRYKLPDSRKSQLIEQPIPIETRELSETLARDVRFSTAVAGFGQLLRGSPYTGTLAYADVIREAQAAKGEDPFGYRTEFVQLVRRAQTARE